MVWIWVGFIGFVLGMLALDLGVFHRKAHAVSMREALGWSAVWIAMGLSFAAFVYFGYEHQWMGLGVEPDPVDGELNNGPAATVKYLTGYVVEKSLSVDNVFVIAVIFGSFCVPAIYQHRVLFWGILGALVMRGAMIALGAELIHRYHWILYVFGGFLLLTAAKMLFTRGDERDPGMSLVVRVVRRFLPVTSGYHGQHFFIRAGSAASHERATPDAPAETKADAAADAARPGTLMITPLFLALLMIETTDLIFAVDSIPAIFAITGDPFLVFTSNVFAILGLRALYFALAGLIEMFRYLKAALAIVLAVVGGKMLAAPWLKDVLGKYANFYLLAAILLVLATGVATSLIANRRAREQEEAKARVR